MATDAGDAERADYQRAHVLGLAENKGYECVTNVLNTMIERERERVEALTLDEKENLIARARLSALMEVARIPADIVENADKILIKWDKRFDK
jgi:DNA repair protein RadC|tara:strand:+ start:2622 stop:2900 length:279 start_codon:yes stop_codon:yes gene_type:complete